MSAGLNIAAPAATPAGDKAVQALIADQRPRRRLAPNVICMFDDDRPPVVNVRRRGRYPRNVTPIASRARLMPGDLAELCGSCLPSNRGKRVRILGPDPSMRKPGEWFAIESLFLPLDTGDVDTRQADGEQRMRCVTLASNLRRVSNRDARWRRL